MKKYEALIKEHEQNRLDVEALRKENEQLQEEITKMESGLNTIARSGDVDAYMQAKNQINRYQAQIEVNAAISAAKSAPISATEIVEAWEDCCRELDKDRQREYEKLLKLLDGPVFEQYKKVTYANLAMLRVREKLDKIGGSKVILHYPVLPSYGVPALGKIYTMLDTNGRDPRLHENNLYKLMEVINSSSGIGFNASLMDETPF